MALSSLPSDQGIGDLYESAYEFIDILKEANIKIWQLLPLNPVGYGSSPYQSECGEAIDPIYISLKYLKDKHYIKGYRAHGKTSDRVDFEKVRKYKEKYFKEAFKAQKDTKSQKFKEFLKNNPWVYQYALFNVLLRKNNYQDWYKWEKEERYAPYHKRTFNDAPYKEEILYIEWLQYIAYKEFELLREYAHKNGVSLMGDIPFYVGLNSSDCWSNQDNFMLDENDVPAFVAGVPPDYFSEDGQRWGNPVYDWEFLQDDNFDFWFQRLENANKLYDYIRIDHFRAFDTYYCIPFNENTARNGFWKKAKGDEFFSLIESRNLDLKIFVEDLGDIIPSVELLRDKYHLIGMNVLEFDLFKRDIEIKQNQVLYTGTHDNNTLVGWYKELDEGKKTLLNIKMRYEKIDGKNFLDAILNFAFKSDAEYLIVPTQDYLGLDSYYRMNTPGTFGEPNWTFRIKSLDELKKKAPYIASLVNKYNR